MSDDAKKEDSKNDEDESIGTFRGGSRLGGSSEKGYSQTIHCPVCGGTYYSMESYNEHLKRVHGK
jgi:hypothetical protein